MIDGGIWRTCSDSLLREVKSTKNTLQSEEMLKYLAPRNIRAFNGLLEGKKTAFEAEESKWISLNGEKK